MDFLRLLNPTNSNIVVSNIQNAVETGTEEIFTEKFSIFVPFAKLRNDGGGQNHIVTLRTWPDIYFNREAFCYSHGIGAPD